MLNFPRWKLWAITLTCLFGVLLAIPSLLPAHVTENWPNWTKPHINLGLDLAGGSQLLLEAETESLNRQRLEAVEDGIRAETRRNNIEIAEVSTADNQLTFTVVNPAQRDQALQIARAQGGGSGMGGQAAEWDVSTADPNRIVMRPNPTGQAEAIKNAMATAREVIDRRINSLGTLEPTIIQQGAERILVQVPGVQDPEAVKKLIGRTARLEFKLLAENVSEEQLASGRAPAGTQLLPTREGSSLPPQIAVQRRAIITGDQIARAQQSFDEQGLPDVSITFDSAGGTRFAKVTRENVGKPFAIILDNVVLSAPSIREPILGGQASISGGFTVEEANDLAISLRSGRLPIELNFIEERTVGPDLGRDSIRLGIIASIVAILLVIVFMLITYGRFGVYAVIGLIINALMILGIMALFNATLTLPGIAGFVLTIGAAVDANVLINERIREEQRRGRRLLDTLETGYKEASTAIFDANITNTIAAALMFYFGSGPIRGFAVVLMIGIITSVFTAVNVTRMFVALWVKRKRPKELHI
ncbi:MAG TPA: protein translocase subunit SecD [Allosphingosinicella sp.]|nr:protein translocase subunit SecD [Allosphingosinicella sp.]